MNKAELTAAIVKKTGFTKKDAEKALGTVTEVPAIPALASRSRSPLPRLPFSRLARP